MTIQDVRSKYLAYFSDSVRKHVVVPSAPLVPENDPTTLFTGSGMQPMVPYLLGAPHPLGNKITDSQKCFRSQDIEEVGDNRHTTFFEMLGNWSLGDYFKQEQLEWLFAFLVDEIGLAPERLYITVFTGSEELQIPRDSESVAIWKTLFAKHNIEAKDVENAEEKGMQGGRIFYYSESKNWWSRSGTPAQMPAGEPGGPDSEVFYDFGEDLGIHQSSPWADQPCHVNCDCGRFMEIGNSVFMQYQKQADGSFLELPQKNVDFGGGLERILAAAQNQVDVFKTDAFTTIISEIEQTTGKAYELETASEMRIIADHLKAAVFLIKDGVRPSNKGQGYVLRRLIRRATVKLQALGSSLDPASLFSIADNGVMKMYDGVYFNRAEDKELINSVLVEEASKFSKSLDRGLKALEKQDQVDGKSAFDLYQSYGFPLEITVELARQKGQEVDLNEFRKEFEKHQELSRSGSAGSFKGGLADHSEQTTRFHTATHLLHAALRQVLGESVQQKGSNITTERLRFDFSHPQALTPAQIGEVEAIINSWVDADLGVYRQEMEKQVALNSGAIAFFIEKYPEMVSVYTIGKDVDKDWISKEFCGGPHVQKTSEIGHLKITKEQAVSAGVRRIYIESR